MPVSYLATNPALAIILIVGITLVVFAVIIIVSIFATRFIRKNLGGGGVQNGVTASGVITEMWDTGATINENPLAGFKIQVTPPDGGAPFVTECKQVVGRLQVAAFQPGAAVTVSYDPANPQKIHITGVDTAQGAGPAAGMNQASVEQRLQQIDAANQGLLATGVSATAQVLRYTDWNVKVNGDNPAVTLQLQVNPPGKPPFMAEASAVISETSVPRFQPGSTIFVKYDPNNFTRVTIDHS